MSQALAQNTISAVLAHEYSMTQDSKVNSLDHVYNSLIPATNTDKQVWLDDNKTGTTEPPSAQSSLEEATISSTSIPLVVCPVSETHQPLETREEFPIYCGRLIVCYSFETKITTVKILPKNIDEHSEANQEFNDNLHDLHCFLYWSCPSERRLMRSALRQVIGNHINGRRLDDCLNTLSHLSKMKLPIRTAEDVHYQRIQRHFANVK